MSLEIKKHNKPKLRIPKCNCDGELNEKLNAYELMKVAFNRNSSASLVIGKPGQGKSTFIQSLFSNSKSGLRGKYTKIFLFCPPRSRESMVNGPLNQLDDDRIYDELNYDNLFEVMEMCKEDNDNDSGIKYRFMLIFDDMGAYLKNKATLKLFNELMMNRRHLRISLLFLVQTFYSVNKDMRRLFENYFIFKVNMRPLCEIFDEVLEEQDKKLIKNISKVVYDEPHVFLYMNSDSGRLFRCFDEIIINEE
jgi:hypothetical protein